MSYSFLGGDSRENFSDQEDLFKVIEGFMGYLPNSHLSMAVNPQLNQSFAALAGTIFLITKNRSRLNAAHCFGFKPLFWV